MKVCSNKFVPQYRRYDRTIQEGTVDSDLMPERRERMYDGEEILAKSTVLCMSMISPY